jgi:hypothetical protein
MIMRVVVSMIVVVVTRSAWQRHHRGFPIVKTEVQSIQLAFDAGQLQGDQGVPFLKAGSYSSFGVINGQLQFIVQFSRKTVQLFVDFLRLLNAGTWRRFTAAHPNKDRQARSGAHH